jgi:hypothetical protein
MLYLHTDGAFYGFAYPDSPIVEYDQFLTPIRIVTNEEESQSIRLGMIEDQGFLDVTIGEGGEE